MPPEKNWLEYGFAGVAVGAFVLFIWKWLLPEASDYIKRGEARLDRMVLKSEESQIMWATHSGKTTEALHGIEKVGIETAHVLTQLRRDVDAGVGAAGLHATQLREADFKISMIAKDQSKITSQLEEMRKLFEECIEKK